MPSYKRERPSLLATLDKLIPAEADAEAEVEAEVDAEAEAEAEAEVEVEVEARKRSFSGYRYFSGIAASCSQSAMFAAQVFSDIR